MSKEKADILSKIGKDAGFKVPDGYFDDFAERSTMRLDDVTRNPVADDSGNQKIYHWADAYRYDTLADMAEVTPKVGNWKVSENGVVWAG